MRGNIYLLITLSVVLSAGAQIALKAGMMAPAVQQSIGRDAAIRQVFTILFTPLVTAGLFLYVASAAVWLLVLARVPVSTAYPFVAVAIVLTAILGRIVFADPFSIAKIVASLLIVSGVVVMAKA